MSVDKINEIIGSSPLSFEDAVQGIAERAHDTLRGVRGIEVLEKRVELEAETPTGREYWVRGRLIFEMAPETVFQA